MIAELAPSSTLRWIAGRTSEYAIGVPAAPNWRMMATSIGDAQDPDLLAFHIRQRAYGLAHGKRRRAGRNDVQSGHALGRTESKKLVADTGVVQRLRLVREAVEQTGGIRCGKGRVQPFKEAGRRNEGFLGAQQNAFDLGAESFRAVRPGRPGRRSIRQYAFRLPFSIHNADLCWPSLMVAKPIFITVARGCGDRRKRHGRAERDGGQN